MPERVVIDFNVPRAYFLFRKLGRKFNIVSLKFMPKTCIVSIAVIAMCLNFTSRWILPAIV